MELEHIEAPLVLCTAQGDVSAATPPAHELLSRVTRTADEPATTLPDGLWWALERVEPGHMIEWRAPTTGADVLGCTRYRANGGFLVVLNELTDQHAALSRRLHRQRLETTGRLVASISHELRNSVAPIVFSADFLAVAGSGLTSAVVQETANEMVVASRRLQFTVDGLLDYARLGPTVSVPVSLRDVMIRSERFLRAHYQQDAHRLVVTIDPNAEWVRGNFLTIEQAFVNLLLNAVEASPHAARVSVGATLEAREAPGAGAPSMVCVRVRDDGPGIPEGMRESIFQPFVTTREEGTGLGLTNAREAVESLGGALVLEASDTGACFAVYLPRGDRR